MEQFDIFIHFHWPVYDGRNFGRLTIKQEVLNLGESVGKILKS